MLIGAIGTFVAVVGGFVLQCINLYGQIREHQRNAARDTAGANRDAKLAVIDANTNGMTKQLADSSHAAGKAEGILIGIAQAKAAEGGLKPAPEFGP